MKTNSSVGDTIEPRKTNHAAPQDRVKQLKIENWNELAAAGQDSVSFEAFGSFNDLGGMAS